MELKGNTHKERCDNQLEEWVRGNPIHNSIDEECCPDFSCCSPESLQPEEIRKTFQEVCKNADKEGFNPDHHPYDDAKMGMLMSFMGGMLSHECPDKNIHITDGDMSERKDLN